MRLIFLIVFILCTRVAAADLPGMEKQLAVLGHRMYQSDAESDRLQANFEFVRTLVKALKTPHSFDYAFDSLKMVSLLRSPDGAFRIFSWHISLSDGSYLYYGTIQVRTEDGSLKMYPLLDKTFELKDPNRAVTTASEWYGAQYYEVVPFRNTYLLLGLKGHTPEVTQKVIEVLSFDTERDLAVFGKPVFEGEGHEGHTRVIYRFAKGISMHLSYQKEQRRLIADHLAPAEPTQNGQYKYYGPDLTFDAWILETEILRLVQEVDYQ